MTRGTSLLLTPSPIEGEYHDSDYCLSDHGNKDELDLEI